MAGLREVAVTCARRATKLGPVVPVAGIAFVALEAELLALVGTPNLAVVPCSEGQGQGAQLRFEALPSVASLGKWQEGNTTTWDA